MNGLKSYFSIVSPDLLKHVRGKPSEFIRLLQEQDYISEDAFVAKVCGEKYDRAYYDNLKSRTIKILQALAIVSAIKGGSPVKKKFDICQKKFTIGQKFLNQGSREEGLRLIKQAYQIAVEYDFVHLACELSSILYHDHVYYHRNASRAKFYSQQVERYLKDYTAEKRAEHHFYQLIWKMSKTVKAEQLLESISQIENLNGNSVKFKVYEASMKVAYGLHSGNYPHLIESCTHALQFFENKKGVYSSHRFFFFMNLGIAQIATQRFTDASESLQKAGKYAPQKSFNDYLLRFYKTLNALHAGEYEVAYTLYKQNRKCRFPTIKQQFAIIEAYLCFLTYMGRLSFNKPFRLGKFLNDTFKAQADKQGDNINILIAELLVHLARNKGRFIDRIEAVSNYSYRHLKGKDTERAKRFIKILCMIPRANFHPIALRRYAEKHIDFLEKHPARMGANFAVEIVPFDVLLGMVLVELGRRAA